MKESVPIKIAGPAPPGSETWPFFVIPVFINGRGPFDFALELHYGKTTLLPECIKELGLDINAITSVMTVPGQGCEIDFLVLRLESIRIGQGILTDFEAMIFKTRDVRFSDSEQQPPARVTAIDRIEGGSTGETDAPFRPSHLGIVGYDFFKNFKLTFDFKNSQLILE